MKQDVQLSSQAFGAKDFNGNSLVSFYLKQGTGDVMKMQIYILSPPLFSPAPGIPPFRRRVSLNHLTVVTFFHGEITFQQRGFKAVLWLNCGSAPVCLQYPNTEVTQSTAVFCSTAETYFQQGSILGIVKFAERGRYLQCGEEEEDSLKSSCCAFGATFWLPDGHTSRKPPPAIATWLSWKSGLGGFWDEIWIEWNNDPSWSRAGQGSCTVI